MQGKAGLWFRRASGVCLLLGAWQLASLFFPPLVVPPIAQVLSTLVRLMTQSDFGATIGTTILRLIAGLAIGVGVGAVLGLLFGLCPKIEDVGTPLIHVLQAIPPVCWVVLALVWFGFIGSLCPTQHRIRAEAVLTLITDMLRAIAEYSRNDRAEFIRTVQETQAAQQTADICATSP